MNIESRRELNCEYNKRNYIYKQTSEKIRGVQVKKNIKKNKEIMPSYKQAYEKAGGSAKLGDYASWEKKAKAWNQKKYGTTEPTAKASKMGMSKSTLASEKASIDHVVKTATHGINSASSSTHKGMRKEGEKKFGAPGHTGRVYLEKGTTKAKVFTPSGGIQGLRAIDLSINATDTKANERMAQTVTSANAPESLLTGKAKRKAKRTEKRDRKSKSKSKSKSVNQNANIDTAMNKLNSSVDKYL